MKNKTKCILTVDVEALPMRAADNHVDRLVYGRCGSGEWGIGKIMDIADSHNTGMTFFLDFAEVELYGDKIIEAGKYIISRGHDLQIHCHYKYLEKKVRERFPNAEKSYYAWYEDSKISDFIVNYCLEQYGQCTEKFPIIFRGGEYRFGKALLEKLKQKGVMADASYHCMRPLKKPALKQFFYENGLLELPVGVVPEQGEMKLRSLNFNEFHLYPEREEEMMCCLEEYEKLFQNFFDYYGQNALASILMHGWSFCYQRKRFQKTGYIDRPNPHAAEFFDRFLVHFREKIDFITTAQAVQENVFGNVFDNTEKIRFHEVFGLQEQRKIQEQLMQIEIFIRQKANGRKVIIWGKGWIESRIMRIRDMQLMLDVPFYISRDADRLRYWREKPVKTFQEAEISPDKNYIFLLANTCFPEIRKNLQAAGFKEYEDYYDAAKSLRKTGGLI